MAAERVEVTAEMLEAARRFAPATRELTDSALEHAYRCMFAARPDRGSNHA